MNAILIDSQTKEEIGALTLRIPPRDNEWIEFNQKMYSIQRVIHGENSIKLMIVGGR